MLVCASCQVRALRPVRRKPRWSRRDSSLRRFHVVQVLPRQFHGKVEQTYNTSIDLSAQDRRPVRH